MKNIINKLLPILLCSCLLVGTIIYAPNTIVKSTAQETAPEETPTDETTTDETTTTAEFNPMSTFLDSEPTILTVGAVGSGATYITLNAALANAENGNIIEIIGNVTAANPAPLVIDKQVTIQGTGGTWTYSVTNWNNNNTPFIISADGVVFRDFNLTITGTTTTATPIMVTAYNVSLINMTVTLGGNAINTKYAPILIDNSAENFYMENVTIPNGARWSSKIIETRGEAYLKNCTFTVPADITALYAASSADLTLENCAITTAAAGAIGIYSENDANLALEDCIFTATNAASTAVSLDSPAGLVLKSSFTFSGAGAGIIFRTPSGLITSETLIVSECTFNQKSAAKIIDLNGYNGSFTDCIFNFTAKGTAIYSTNATNATLNFTGCSFNTEITSSVCVDVSNISAVIIDDSDFTLNGQYANGVKMNSIPVLTLKDSGFIATATTYPKGILANGVQTGTVTGCVFDIAKSNSIGLNFTDSGNILLKNNTFTIAEAGKGASMINTTAEQSKIIMENNKITATNTKSEAFRFERFNSFKISNAPDKNEADILMRATTNAAPAIAIYETNFVEIDNIDIDLKTTVSTGILIDGKTLPNGQGGEIKITNTHVNIENVTGATKGIEVDSVSKGFVDNFSGNLTNGAINSVPLGFIASANIEVQNSQFNVDTTVRGRGLSFTGSETVLARNYKLHDNIFIAGEQATALVVGVKNTHNAEVYENTFTTSKSTAAISIGYGRTHLIHDNIFISTDVTTYCIISDGVDEDKLYFIEKDTDIYDASGNIIEDNRNRIYKNTFEGKFAQVLYITNNGDVIEGNDLTKVTLENPPAAISNYTQMVVGYCKDVQILNNKFTKTKAIDEAIIGMANSIIAKMTGNITQFADSTATQVLVAKGRTDKAPSGEKIPESIILHDATNLIASATPKEIENKWSDNDSIYQYILELPVVEPIRYYAVEYFYDDMIDVSKTLKSMEMAGAVIKSYTEQLIDGYEFSKVENFPLTISTDEANNVIKVYYTRINTPPPTTTSEETTTETPEIVVATGTTPETTTTTGSITTTEATATKSTTEEDTTEPTIKENTDEDTTESTTVYIIATAEFSEPPTPIEPTQTQSEPATTATVIPVITVPATEPATELTIPEPATEPAAPPEIVFLPEGVELIEYDDFEELLDNAIPLSNGWFAVDLSGDWWQIFDEIGVPLGVFKFTGDIKDTSIENLDIAHIELNMIPIGNVMTATAAVAPPSTENATEPPKNPNTGDRFPTVIFALATVAVIAVTAANKKNKKKIE